MTAKGASALIKFVLFVAGIALVWVESHSWLAIGGVILTHATITFPDKS